MARQERAHRGPRPLLVTTAGILYWFFTKSVSSRAGNTKSVAVLPFENFSDNKEDSYFSGGLLRDRNSDSVRIESQWFPNVRSFFVRVPSPFGVIV
jgi:hypothetical protein